MPTVRDIWSGDSSRGETGLMGEWTEVRTKAKCVECGRVFDLLDEEEASEFHYGHDCEGE